MRAGNDSSKPDGAKPFTLVQISDQGTRNPIVARLKIGLFEVIQMAQILDDRKTLLKTYCYDIGKDLVLAEKAATPLMSELREAEKRIETEGLKIQNGRVVELPAVLHLDEARVFLKYAKQALQTLAKALGLILEKDFSGPHFHKIRDFSVQKLGAKHPLSKSLIEDQVWLKEINDLRNEDEHPTSGRQFMTSFDVLAQKDGKWPIDVPRFFNGTPILNRLEVYSHNLLTFSEESIVNALTDFFPAKVQVQEIPEDRRDPGCPVRFRFGLKS